MRVMPILSLATVAVGALVALLGVWFAVRSTLRAQNWKPASATVVSVALESRVDSDNMRFFYGVYKVQYEAEGRCFESNVRSSPQTSSEAEIRARIARHPPGTLRGILYNPANPAEIEMPGRSAMAVPFGFVMMGLIFLVAGGAMWYGTRPADW